MDPYELFMYWDPMCDGVNLYNEWIFDVSEPSLTAESDLDGDGDCDYAGFIGSISETPPSGVNLWNIGCDADGFNHKVFVPTNIDIVEIPNPYNDPHCFPTIQPTPSPTNPEPTSPPTDIRGITDPPTLNPSPAPTVDPNEFDCPIQSVITEVVFNIPCTKNR